MFNKKSIESWLNENPKRGRHLDAVLTMLYFSSDISEVSAGCTRLMEEGRWQFDEHLLKEIYAAADGPETRIEFATSYVLPFLTPSFFRYVFVESLMDVRLTEGQAAALADNLHTFLLRHPKLSSTYESQIRLLLDCQRGRRYRHALQLVGFLSQLSNQHARAIINGMRAKQPAATIPALMGIWTGLTRSAPDMLAFAKSEQVHREIAILSRRSISSDIRQWASTVKKMAKGRSMQSVRKSQKTQPRITGGATAES